MATDHLELWHRQAHGDCRLLEVGVRNGAWTRKRTRWLDVGGQHREGLTSSFDRVGYERGFHRYPGFDSEFTTDPHHTVSVLFQRVERFGTIVHDPSAFGGVEREDQLL